MSLIQSISRGAGQLRADVSGAPAPWDDFWYAPIGVPSSSGMRITADSAKRIGAVIACVGIIARNMAMFPKKVMTDMAGGGSRAVPSHPVYDLLASRPNDRQTSFEFFQMMQGHVELRGNAYAEIIPGPRGAVDQLMPLHPDRIHVKQLLSGRLIYPYDDPLTKQQRILVQEEVFHLKNWSDDGIVGQSTVAMAVDVFGAALAQQDYSSRFFQNDAKPGGVIEGTNFQTKEDADAFRENLQQAQTGKNRHKNLILPTGLSYKEIGVTPNDSQLLDAQKFSRVQICSLFPIPPHMIGEAEKAATYASVEQFNIMLVVQCFLPRVVMWEQAIQRDLIISPKYYAKFGMAALLRGDTAARYAAYQIAIANGWMSPNDVRMLEDLGPIEGGDTYWRPLNWAPLTQIDNPASGDSPEPADVTDSGGSGTAMAGRLRLLASSAAERCVRKEVAAVRKLIDRDADVTEVDAFYADHAEFIAGVLNIPIASAQAYGCGRAVTVKIARDIPTKGMTDIEERRCIAQLTDLAVKGIQ